MIAGLELVALAQGTARVLDPRRKRIADRLQLAEVQHARLTREGRHVAGNPHAAKCFGDEARKLAFEPPDLAPQLTTGEALVATHTQRTPTVSFEQMRHSRIRV